MKKIFFLLLFISLQFHLSAQREQVDSLIHILNTEQKDYNKAIELNKLAILYFNFNIDSSMLFAKRALKISIEINNTKEIAQSHNILGRAYAYIPDYDSAQLHFTASLSQHKKNDNNPGIINTNKRIGIILLLQSKFDLSIKHLLTAMSIAEKTKNLLEKQSISSNLGVLYSEIDDTKKAFKYINESLELSIKLNIKPAEVIAYENIAQFHHKNNEFRKALYYHKKALLLATQENLRESMAQIHLAIGQTYYELKKYDRALNNEVIALKEFEKIGIRKDIASLYVNIGMANIKLKQYEIAKENLLLGLAISQKTGSKITMSESYFHLAQLDSLQGKFNTSLAYYQKYSIIKDSIYSLQKDKTVREVQVKYDVAKKEAEYELLKEKEKVNDGKIRKQDDINKSLIVVSILFVVIIIITVRSSYRVKKFNTLLSNKNTIIKAKNTELNNTKKEVDTQKNNLEWQNKKLIEHEYLRTSSIKYALKIQMAVLPDRFLMDTLFKEYFIFLKPLQIVSGDFYWLKKIDKNIIFAVADCTGHGVPGAFLSMLGISTLFDVVNKYESLKASDILERLRATVKNALKQSLKKKNSEDGMDISLCVFNTETKTLQFSGAHRPLYLVVNNSTERFSEFKESKTIQISSSKTHSLIEIKPDKQPIGTFIKEKPFTNHEIKIHASDTIYLFSDGFPDQFNDLTNEKFTSKRFKELILSVQGMTMPSQKKMIKNAFVKWIGNSSQTDDILIGGVKFS